MIDEIVLLGSERFLVREINFFILKIMKLIINNLYYNNDIYIMYVIKKIMFF